MRYLEQLKYSTVYHWWLLCEIWDLFTLSRWHWLILGLFIIACVLPDAGVLAPILGVASVILLAVAYLREG